MHPIICSKKNIALFIVTIPFFVSTASINIHENAGRCLKKCHDEPNNNRLKLL
uniref:Uncharacterized protein n=1 Tax=Arundo donax TaxID=35708 RepID=A0A0A8YQ15_ARUDO